VQEWAQIYQPLSRLGSPNKTICFLKQMLSVEPHLGEWSTQVQPDQVCYAFPFSNGIGKRLRNTLPLAI
jgi:hypothetical protein